MKLWEDFRNYFYTRKLNAALRKLNRERSIVNWSDAKSIGILFHSKRTEESAVIEKFADKLKSEGKDVTILAFIKSSRKEEISGPYPYFTKRNLNWTLIPDEDVIRKFADTRFDLLFCCFTEENLPLEYTSAVSNAKWRVGMYDEKKTMCYDLMINLNNNKELSYFITQATDFLNQLKYDSK